MSATSPTEALIVRQCALITPSDGAVALFAQLELLSAVTVPQDGLLVEKEAGWVSHSWIKWGSEIHEIGVLSPHRYQKSNYNQAAKKNDTSVGFVHKSCSFGSN